MVEPSVFSGPALAAIGLKGARVGAAEHIEVQTGPLGFAPSPLGPVRVPRSVPALERSGFAVATDEALAWLILTAREPPVRFSCPVPAAIATCDGTEIALQLRWLTGREPGPPAIAILGAADSGVVLQPGSSAKRPCGFAVAPVVGRPAPQLEGGMPLRTDVASWVGSLADPWLRDEVDAIAARQGDLSHVVAAGLLLRLREDPPSERRSRVLGLLAGGRTTDEPELAWARSIGADPSALIDMLAHDIAYSLERDALELREQVGDHVRDAFCALLVRRDDLECVRAVLAAGQRGQSLRRCLERVDAAVRAHLSAVSQPVDDERLSRAGRVDPLAWWTAPAFGVPLEPADD